jgi:hypothetical protein
MGGLQPSDLIIVAGRPGMGKTRSPPTSPTTSPEYRGKPRRRLD